LHFLDEFYIYRFFFELRTAVNDIKEEDEENEWKWNGTRVGQEE